jgi:molybdopterin/thiamine biosynthesis adenylyltransferase/rhodanese-related sulfurtransferase
MTALADLLLQATRVTKEISLVELKRRIDEGVPCTLIDVRENEEFRRGRLPGALNLSRGYLELRAEHELPDKSAPIVTYCAAGTRSALAAKTLFELGYTNVETANPGFDRWKELGYPTEGHTALNLAQRERYARHLRLPGVGESGQARLAQSKVLVVGLGGLGAPASLYLAAAGVGTLGLADADTVDVSNLQRQVIHTTSRIGMPKVESAALAIADLNPEVNVITHRVRLDAENIDAVMSDYDVVIDASDNFATRYAVNDASLRLGKPVVHGSVFRFEGHVTTFGVESGPCYRCLHPQSPPTGFAPSCEEAGVLGVLPGVVGMLQATEALKWILGKGTSLNGRVLVYDSLRMTFHEWKLQRNETCISCGCRAPLMKVT